jgi:pimeloyl-ACP methyl ester carboxylesterase
MTTSGPRHLAVELPGLSVAALTWGPPDGPLALCLHGFPDTAWSWRHVGPALAADGWRVVAPFSRGYAPTSLAPDGCYQTGALVSDVVALHGAFGGDDRALLVGHDWGALTAYGVGGFAPDLFARIVAMSVPPIPTFQRVLRGRRGAVLGLRQLRRSWYILANQVPGLPERVLPALVRRLWSAWSPGYVAAADLRHVADALPAGPRRTAALRYYRSFAQPWQRSSVYRTEQQAVLGVPRAPVLYLHGEQDGCLLPDLGRASGGDLASGSRVRLIPGAGHFLQLEQPDLVHAEIARFAR